MTTDARLPVEDPLGQAHLDYLPFGPDSGLTILLLLLFAGITLFSSVLLDRQRDRHRGGRSRSRRAVTSSAHGLPGKEIH